MIIAVDVMGGDLAPDNIVRGTLDAVKEYDTQAILVGKRDEILHSLEKNSFDGDPRVIIEDAEECITMDDLPSQVIRGKRKSSVHAMLNLVKSGKADACYSAGNTGATMAVAMFTLRKLSGIDRPAIATTLPTVKGRSVLLDIGANVDSKPENILQFAIMGSAYAKSVLNLSSPTVGLLSIGEEDGKGNEITKNVFSLLKNTPVINFKGNIEPKEMYKGNVDVVVCDGFVGNIALKSSEGVSVLLSTILKEELNANVVTKFGAFLLGSALRRFKKRINYEEFGGAPLLGVGGVCIIGHGSSSPYAVKNAIRVAKEMVTEKMNASIEADVKSSLEILKNTK